MNKVLLILVFSIASPWMALAGGINGGGGVSVVCRDIQGKIIQSTLLDLYESTKSGFRVRPASGDILKDFVGFMVEWRKKYQDPRIYELPADKLFLEDFLKKMNFVNAPLRSSNDLGDAPYAAPSGCKLEQVALYTDAEPVFDDKDQVISVKPEALIVDSSIWNSFDSMSKAALVMHEYIYWIHRMTTVMHTSTNVRALVAALAADNSPPGAFADAPQGKSYLCTGGDNSNHPTELLIYDDPNNKDQSVLQIVRYFGLMNTFLSRHTFPKFDPQFLIPEQNAELGSLLRVSDPRAAMTGMMYYGQNMLNGKNFSVEYAKGKAFSISRLSVYNERQDTVYIQECHIWQWIIPSL